MLVSCTNPSETRVVKLLDGLPAPARYAAVGRSTDSRQQSSSATIYYLGSPSSRTPDIIADSSVSWATPIQADAYEVELRRGTISGNCILRIAKVLQEKFLPTNLKLSSAQLDSIRVGTLEILDFAVTCDS
jgi:hypothetical protein